MSKPDWENFAKAVLADWPTGDLEGSVLFDLSLQYGMIQEVPGGYNSDRHFDNEGICPEEGDPWYEYTFRGEAGPGLYSIHALSEQLEAARADAKEAEAYAEELEKRVAFVEEERRKTFQALLKVTKIHDDVEAKLATCEKYRDAYAECDRIGTQAVRDLEDKLAKAVEGLRDAVDAWDNHNKTGDMMQGHWVTDARATLAEIEGEKG
jgi:hypothetical protein